MKALARFLMTTLPLLAAFVVLAGPAAAQSPRLVLIDLEDAASYDGLNLPINTRFTIDLDSDERISLIEVIITGIYNDPLVGADEGSWPSEARIAVQNSGLETLLIIPLYSEAYNHNSTTDPPDLTTVFSGAALSHPSFTGPGTLTIQLYEELDDEADTADGVYLAGSQIRVTIVPEPHLTALLLTSAAWALRRRRVA